MLSTTKIIYFESRPAAVYQKMFEIKKNPHITGATLFVRTNAVSSFFQFHLCRARKLSFTFAVAPVPGLLHRDGNFGTEKNDTAFLTKKGTNKVAPVISFGPRTQNDDFLGTRPRAAPLGSCQKNSSFFVLGTKLLFCFVLFCWP